MQTALTIAGSDPGGGAGVQADLKTFAAHGVFGLSAISAITVQNTRGVTRVVAIAPDLVAAQIDAVASDFAIDAVKIGMLANADLVDAVVLAIAHHRLERVVLDPVIAATHGLRLLDDAGLDALRTRLMPLVTVVTPNAQEAEALSGVVVRTIDDQRAAAARLVELGARAAIVSGGHLAGAAVDVLFDGHLYVELRADRIDTPHTHGTGCTFSSALAARLAEGDNLDAAARAAKA